MDIDAHGRRSSHANQANTRISVYNSQTIRMQEIEAQKEKPGLQEQEGN